MRGVITAPNKIITGAFTLLFSFPSDIDLTAADIQVETLEGDALGHAKDSFRGRGNHYHLLCYLPDERAGKSRFSVTKPGVDVAPVVVEYDTVRKVVATWGTPVKQNRKIEVPLSFDASIRRLRKQHFLLFKRHQFQVYGTGDTYQLVVSAADAPFRVVVSGTVQKTNGLQAVIVPSVVEVK